MGISNSQALILTPSSRALITSTHTRRTCNLWKQRYTSHKDQLETCLVFLPLARHDCKAQPALLYINPKHPESGPITSFKGPPIRGRMRRVFYITVWVARRNHYVPYRSIATIIIIIVIVFINITTNTTCIITTITTNTITTTSSIIILIINSNINSIILRVLL